MNDLLIVVLGIVWLGSVVYLGKVLVYKAVKKAVSDSYRKIIGDDLEDEVEDGEGDELGIDNFLYLRGLVDAWVVKLAGDFAIDHGYKAGAYREEDYLSYQSESSFEHMDEMVNLIRQDDNLNAIYLMVNTSYDEYRQFLNSENFRFDEMLVRHTTMMYYVYLLMSVMDKRIGKHR